MEIFLLFFGIPAGIVLIEFLCVVFNGKGVFHPVLLAIIEVFSLAICPLLFVAYFGTTNSCCGDSTVFAPDHQLTILIIVLLCLVGHFYSSHRTKMAAPVVEIVVNSLLVIAIVLNVFIAIQLEEALFVLCGNLPIIMLMVLALFKNQKLFMQSQDFVPANTFEKIAWKILTLNPFVKFPVIFILCLPLIVIIIAILLLVGQKPDSLIRAFTDTYKHGFSQLDYQCDNVQCGGHYLCSVAANGHKEIVKPKRLGKRNGGTIICNRQLLISNAFEELVQEKMPFLHRQIRTRYDKVGDLVHRYYGIFNIKLVSDVIYIVMKPLEWFFLLTLYTFDKKPENRIARQYLTKQDTIQLTAVEQLS